MTTTVLNSTIIDVNADTFNQDVIEQSHITPVVVDFWAAWCGPCRSLGPILEKVAQEYQGKFILAKVDVDQNQTLARQYGVQGIPAIKAFVEGEVVGEFTGAQPEAEVRGFIEKLIPSIADMYARQGYQWEMNDQLAMAVTNYEGALKEDPEHYPAMVGLGRSLMKLGKIDDSINWLSKVPQGTAAWRVADGLITTARFQHHAEGHTEEDLRAKIDENPHDLDSRFILACLLAVDQRLESALEEFLAVVQRNKQYQDGAARKAMLTIFTTIGDDHPITKRYQQLLARALF